MKIQLSKEMDYQSDFFTLYELSEGIYTAQIKENSFAGSNGGFFDLGGVVIMWDTFLNIDAAWDLFQAIKKITGGAPNFVVISHYHTDHILGNYRIPNHIPIISGPTVVELIKEISQPQVEIFAADPAKKLADLREKLKIEADPVQQRDKKLDIHFYEYLLEHNPDFRLPNMLFTGELEFRGTKTTLILKNVGARHTKEDIIAVFPEEKICFMGDLFSSSWFDLPLDQIKRFLTTDPIRHVEILEDLSSGPLEIFVSGHGDPGGPEDLRKSAGFIREHYMD